MMICNINNNERVSLLFILMLCLSGERFLRGLPNSRASSEEIEFAQAGERKQSGIGERKKGDLSPFLMLRRVDFE